MNVVDSAAWLEYFGDGPNAGAFADAITDTERLVVPAITLFEVFKRIRLDHGLDAALYAVAHMQRGRVVDLDAHLAVAAAELSAESGLSMADSVVLATSRAAGAVLLTQDADLEGLEGVECAAGGEAPAGRKRVLFGE